VRLRVLRFEFLVENQPDHGLFHGSGWTAGSRETAAEAFWKAPHRGVRGASWEEGYRHAVC
jgi:hypothetical protein